MALKALRKNALLNLCEICKSVHTQAMSTPTETELVLTHKPDAAAVCRRMDAWWHGEIIDRATIQVTAPKPNRIPLPQKQHATFRERWMDVDYVVECAAINIANTYWAGESLPIFMPNLGPEILTTCYGSDLDFTENTSWSKPILHDWADIPGLRINPDSPYLRTILDITRRALDVGRGKFVVGITDIHPGADLAASFRDPQQLCVDLAESPEQVHALVQQIRRAFFDFYEINERVILDAGQSLCTSWLPLWVNHGRYYIPSNDFSITISNRMFEEFFLPELIEEIEWLDRSIYHLDGPGALRHLDTLLDIKKLDAIQYVYGDGARPASRWLDVYKRIQDAGKNLHISVDPWEVDAFIEHLRPEGVMLYTSVATVEEADALVAKAAKWTKRGGA